MQVRILSTLNRELLKPSASVALHRHSNALVDVLPPEADSSISLLSQSEKPDVTYQVCLDAPWVRSLKSVGHCGVSSEAASGTYGVLSSKVCDLDVLNHYLSHCEHELLFDCQYLAER
jgi:Proteasomal ATPase OB C-terminal domain